MNRYAMLAMSFAAQMCLGCSYAWSVFAMTLKEQYAIEPWQAMSFYSVSTAAFAFTTLLSGSLQDRFGPRAISVVGGLLYGGGIGVAPSVSAACCWVWCRGQPAW